jgi:hypothetical protein
MREEIVALENDADILAQFAQMFRVPVEHMSGHLDPAGLAGFQAVDAAQQRALAGAGAPDDGDDLACLDAQRHTLEHLDRAKALVDIFNDDCRHSSPFRDVD